MRKVTEEEYFSHIKTWEVICNTRVVSSIGPITECFDTLSKKQVTIQTVGKRVVAKDVRRSHFHGFDHALSHNTEYLVS